MELANQINFIIFGLVAFALLIGALSQFQLKQADLPSIYWPISIGFLALRSLAFGLSPLISPFLLTIANTALISSTLALVFLYRSWQGEPFSKPKSIAIWCIPLVIALFYEPLRTTPNTFPQRVALIVGSQVLIMFWQLYELYKASRHDSSKFIRWLMVMSAFEIIASTLRIYQTLISGGPSNIFIYSEGGWAFAFRWLAYIVETLELIIIGVFYLEKRINKENRTSLELSHTQLENVQINKLLNEKEQLLAELIKANKTAATGALAASIAHELNQPLGASQLNIDFLKLKLDQNDFDPLLWQELLTQLKTDNQRASSIIKSLRSIFLSEDTILEKQDLKTLIESVLIIVGPALQKNNIKLVLDIPPDVVLPLNEGEMKQVFVNLLNNAIYALITSENQNKEIQITGSLETKNVRIAMTDNGLGVSPSVQSNLFELLSSNGKATGMGLGLWLCKHIVARHNGRIWHEKAPSGGASFILELPAT